MSVATGKNSLSRGLALAGVQFFFTLGWTVYALYLPDLLKGAGLAASWLPWLLMVDQLIFAAMDIAFGIAADRMADTYRRLARLLLWLTSLSAVAFLLLPSLAPVSPGLLLLVLAIWVISASVVRAPTMVLLAKRAKAAQQGQLVLCYAGGMALASALSPFLGLWLKGVDPQLVFALSGLALLGAVLVLLRLAPVPPDLEADDGQQPVAFASYLPLLAVLGLAAFGFQVHAFVNAAPLYLLHVGKDSLPWLMPLLWLGFFATLLAVSALVKRFAAWSVVAAGLLLTALASYGAGLSGGLAGLIGLQLLTGAGWAMVFGGLMEQAGVDGRRGAEGLFMGSFFAVLAISSFARIALATQYLPLLQPVRFELPAALLLAAGFCLAVYVLKRPKFPSGPGRG
ncbi:MFS transporter [Quatrionicoccus australiensis]|uniref:MFS transporter n=1 Tax=Quatrionicoccus australiensis TaxID=138118 RepID=UPI001CF83B2F|nr:MFS transporter [Quatrionicoccus australiensis]UCV14690.1 MFS transporter [Quatrionicoccus australiensis]